MSTITVITPTIPARRTTLARALASVAAQTLSPAAHVVVVDHAHEGPARARNRALEAVTSDFVAFLDDDDELYPDHLSRLYHAAIHATADVVYSQHHGAGAGLERPFDAELLEETNYIPVTTLVRTAAIRAIGGFPDLEAGEDWAAWILLARAGGRFVYVEHPTWCYHRTATGRHATRPANAREEVLRYVAARSSRAAS